jgi:hypothetical protein
MDRNQVSLVAYHQRNLTISFILLSSPCQSYLYNNNQTLTNRKAGINPYFDHLSVRKLQITFFFLPTMLLSCNVKKSKNKWQNCIEKNRNMRRSSQSFSKMSSLTSALYCCRFIPFAPLHESSTNGLLFASFFGCPFCYCPFRIL